MLCNEYSIQPGNWKFETKVEIRITKCNVLSHLLQRAMHYSQFVESQVFLDPMCSIYFYRNNIRCIKWCMIHNPSVRCFCHSIYRALINNLRLWYAFWQSILTERDWDKFIQHNMTLYRCMISDIHDSSYVLFSTNLISNTSFHVGRSLLRPLLVAYAEATLARQKNDSATNEKWWHHIRILIADKWSVVWN